MRKNTTLRSGSSTSAPRVWESPSRKRNDNGLSSTFSPDREKNGSPISRPARHECIEGKSKRARSGPVMKQEKDEEPASSQKKKVEAKDEVGLRGCEPEVSKSGLRRRGRRRIFEEKKKTEMIERETELAASLRGGRARAGHTSKGGVPIFSRGRSQDLLRDSSAGGRWIPALLHQRKASLKREKNRGVVYRARTRERKRTSNWIYIIP